MQKVIMYFDTIFSFFVFVAIMLLTFFMAARLGFGAYHLVSEVFSGQFFDEEALATSGKNALQSIAEIIIFIKAYRILVSYLRTHHISVEYIVEISIITSSIELLFAHTQFDISTKIILAIFGVANLIIYLHYYAPSHNHDHLKVKNSSRSSS